MIRLCFLVSIAVALRPVPKDPMLDLQEDLRKAKARVTELERAVEAERAKKVQDTTKCAAQAKRANARMAAQNTSEEHINDMAYLNRKVMEMGSVADLWKSKKCEDWDLYGNWSEEKKRGVYIAFMFSDEFEVLDVVLYELAPVVDHIILVETDRKFSGEPKPLLFEQYRYLYKDYFPKLVHVPLRVGHDNSTMSRAETVSKLQVLRDKGERDPWLEEFAKHQTALPDNGDKFQIARWRMRRAQSNTQSETALNLGIKDDDVFVVFDIDEVISREMAVALSHCDALPPPTPEVTCYKRAFKVFGSKYHFNRTEVASVHKKSTPKSHFHPDMTYGKCLRPQPGAEAWGAESLRHNVPERDRERCIQENKTSCDWLKGWATAPQMKTIGGWHLYSFTTTESLLEEQTGRAGAQYYEKDSEFFGCNLDDIRTILDTDKADTLSPGASLNVVDHMVLPKLIQDHQEDYQFFHHYVPDYEWPTQPRRPHYPP